MKTLFINLKGATFGVTVALGLALAAFSHAADTSPPAMAKAGGTDYTTLSLEDLGSIKLPMVYTASKRDENVSDSPFSVSVVTAEDIQRYGYRTLGDILNSVGSVYMSSDNVYPTLGIRGFGRPGDYGGRNLLMVDGHRLNEAVFDTTAYGHDFLLDVGLIDRVEVVRGAGSTLYGNNAFFSVVNVIPKRGRDYNWAEFSAGGGSLDTYQGRFTVGKQLTNGLEFLLSGTYYQSQGASTLHYVSADPSTPLANGGVISHHDFEKASSFFTQFRYNDFTLSGGYVWREKAVSTAAFGGVFNDPKAINTDEPGYADLKYEHTTVNDWSILARVGYTRDAYSGLTQQDPLQTGNPANYVLNLDHSYSDAADAEVQVGKTIFDRHQLMLGAEFRDMFNNVYLNEDLAPPNTIYVNSRAQRQSWGIFANSEWQLYRTNLVFHAGIREDFFSDYDSALSPRLALVAKPWNSTTFKLSWGSAYRTPNVYESLYNSQPGYGGMPAPKPETIHTWELGWEQAYGKHFRTTVTAYRSDIHDLIDYAPGGTNMVNIGVVNSQGLEFEVEGRSDSGLRGRLSYCLQTTKDSVTGQSLNNSTENLAKFNLSFPLYKDKIFAGLELQYNGAVENLNNYKISDYWLMNATLFSQKFVKGMEFTVSVKNLFDEQYTFPASQRVLVLELPQPGRTLWCQLTYKF